MSIGLAGENISLSLEYPNANEFRESGYANIVTNDSYIGGVVRQTENLLFARVFEAGHYGISPFPFSPTIPELTIKPVHAAQPETFYRIFNRTLSSLDIATGTISVAPNSHYRTQGPASSFSIKNILPPSPLNECNVWQAGYSCTETQLDALANGTALVESYIVVEPRS